MLGSPKALILAVVLTLAIGGVIYLGVTDKKPNQVKKTNASGKFSLRKDQIEKLEQDTDNDGLKNWEELIYHTDSNNPDTDKDGTPDGTETRLNRDPLVPGPNDKLEPVQDIKKPTQLNITQDFANAFLKEPIAQIIAGQGINVDAKLVELYADRLLSKSVLNDAPKITAENLKITDSTGENIKKYFIDFEKIFRGLKAESETEITIKAFQEQNYEILSQIDEDILSHDKAIASLKNMEVPSELGKLHVKVTNYLILFKKSAEIMRNAEADPIQAMMALNERASLNKEFLSYLSDLKGGFEKILEAKK